MMDRIYLFDSTETYRALATNENPGALSFFDAVWVEKLNGEVTLEFAVDATHPDAEFVTEDSIAIISNLEGGYQSFIIRKVDETHSERGLIKQAYCENAANELIDEPVREFSTENDNPANIIEVLLSNTRWEVGQVDTFPAQAFAIKNANVLNAINQLVETFGCEIRFRTEITPGNARITGRYVDVLARRGAETGRRFEYTRDVTSIKKSSDASDIKTALIGLGKGETDSETGTESRVTFTNVEWSVDNGDPVDKPAGQDWVGDPEALKRYGRINSDGSLRHRFGYFEDSDEENAEELLRKTWEALQTVNTPVVQYEMSVIDLERLSGYDHMRVRLGDTVHVIDREFSPELLVEARVIEIERYLNEPERTVIKLGNFLPEMTDSEERVREIERKLGDREGIWNDKIGLGQVIDVYNNEIRSSNGYVYITDKDGILVLDKPKDQNPTKAVRIKGGVIGISDNYQGDDTVYRTAMDGDGIVADVITTGTMRADRIKGGNLTLGGSGQMGRMWVYDQDDKLVAEFDAGYGGYRDLYIGNLQSPTVVNRSTPQQEYLSWEHPERYVIYVRPFGDDAHGDGSIEKPFRTLQRAINSIPQYNSALWTIDCRTPSGSSPYTFYEHVEIRGFLGDGKIYIDMSGSYFMGEVRMSANLQYIEIIGGKWRHDGWTHPLDTRPYATINCLRTYWVFIHDAVIFADNADYCIGSQASHAILRNVRLVGSREGALYARDGGSIHGADVSGSGHRVAVIAAAAGHVSLIDSTTSTQTPIPAAGSSSSIAGGGTFLYNGTLVTRSYSETPPMNGLTLKVWPDYGGSWRFGNIDKSYRGGDIDDGWGWTSDGIILQGAEYYAREDSYGKNNVGFVWLYAYEAQEHLQGKQILDVRIRFQRMNEFGQNKPHELFVYEHDYFRTLGEPETFDPTVTIIKNGVSVGLHRWGEDLMATLPTSVGENIRDGKTSGLAFFNPDYTQSAQIALNSILLEITYR
jgi:phage minor structural protein